MRYRKLLPLGILVLVAACSDLATTPTDPGRPNFAPGTGAHFSDLSASVDADGNLDISGTESGLGNSPGTPVALEMVAHVDFQYACINGGNNHPKAANKETFGVDVGGTGTANVRKNGSAAIAVEIEVPTASQVDFSCPSGQRLELVFVEYSDVFISDLTNSNTAGVQDVPVTDGTFSRTFFTLP